MIHRSAQSLAEGIRKREFSCMEIARDHLRRIEAVNPKLNAVVQICADRALDEARAADELLASGAPIGPLHGVPITIKDNLNTAGIVTTGGTQGRARFVPSDDATAVARLRKAGAILLGKTNTPELTMAYETDNLVYGRTNNPYDLARTPGGSSGGAAAILAAGGSALDIGSDTGGSIRVPSHFCGTAGLKPTAGRIPQTGSILPFGGIIDAMTQLGPMARTAADLAFVLPLLAGIDWRDPSAVPMPLAVPSGVRLNNLKIAYFVDNGISKPAPEMAAAMGNALRILQAAGAGVEEARPGCVAETSELTLALWTADGGWYFEQVLEEAETGKLHPFINGVLPGGCPLRPRFRRPLRPVVSFPQRHAAVHGTI